ncbi:MAG: hypothetical protein K0R82_947 [Flavipsychrobacter sp.]|jgi:hypothetical protein|nr:hypothetical protein [Flavipsychrobacter sp.]
MRFVICLFSFLLAASSSQGQSRFKPKAGSYTFSADEIKKIRATYDVYQNAKDASFMLTVAGSSYAAIAKTQGASAEGVQKALNVLGFYQVKPGMVPSKQAQMLALKMRNAGFLRAKVLRPAMYIAAAVAVYEVYTIVNSGKTPEPGATLQPLDRSKLQNRNAQNLQPLPR